MKPLPTVLLCLSGAIAGTGIGWLLRGGPVPRNPNAISGSAVSGAASPAGTGKTTPAARASTNHSDKDGLAAELARQTGALRWLYLLGAAEKATAADMQQLLRAADGMPGALRMLAVRWAELDPQHMFRTLCADASRYRAGGEADLTANYDLPHILFEEWTKKDPEAAIAALNDRGVIPRVESLRYSLTNTVMKSDPARGLKLMTDWNITSFIPDMDGITKWAQQNPRVAAEAAASANLGHAASEAMQRIGKAWAASDPAAALEFAAEKRGLAGIHLAQSVIAEWAQHDLSAAIAHVSAQNDSLALTRLGIPLVEAWAKSDPQAALVWANENLKGEARAAAAASVVKTMAAQDINRAAEFIGGLEPGGAKNRAVNQLVETWLGKDRKEDATAALTWMAALPDVDARRQAMEQSSWRLFYAAADETIAFLNSPQGATAPQQLFDRAAQHLAQKNPESAMQWADALPPGHRRDARDAVLGEWMSTRPDAAMEWVRAQPKGGQRDASITAATMHLAWQSVETTRRWLESLPAADHAAAAAGLKSNGSLSTENRAALEALVK